jgi:hypothetical protein
VSGIATVLTHMQQAAGLLKFCSYLQEQGVAFTADTMSAAAENGHTHVCQYLHAEQCPWDFHATVSAALHGHTATLRWLHDSGCEW